ALKPRRLRERLPLRGAGAERLRGVTAPKASRRVSACAEGASAPPPPRGGTPLRHASRATSPQGEALGLRCLRGKAPLEGSWRGALERWSRTAAFQQGFGVCRGRLRAAAAARRHTSPSRFACHLSSRRGFRAALPERCHRTKGLQRGYGSIFE